MGMYTEIVVSTRLKALPPLVFDALNEMCGEGSLDEEQEKRLAETHPLFKTPRWRGLFTCSSYYFVPKSMQVLEFEDIGKTWCLIVRADLKNYDNEIELFFDFIRPFLEDQDEAMIGYSRYEEDTHPTIYYANGTKRVPSPNGNEMAILNYMED